MCIQVRYENYNDILQNIPKIYRLLPVVHIVCVSTNCGERHGFVKMRRFDRKTIPATYTETKLGRVQQGIQKNYLYCNQDLLAYYYVKPKEA